MTNLLQYIHFMHSAQDDCPKIQDDRVYVDLQKTFDNDKLKIIWVVKIFTEIT